MSTAIATKQAPSLVQKFAHRFNMDPSKLMGTLKATAFKQQNGEEVSNEQMAALLIVADQYGLNPFTRELFAFPDKAGIVPVVSVDGWCRIINDHPQADGIEFVYAEETTQHDGAKDCPDWIECHIHRKDRAHPTIVREYLDETYRPPMGKYKTAGPWQSHTRRMLRHKTLIQCARVAFGFSGIYDEDEATRIQEAHTYDAVATPVAQPEALPSPANGLDLDQLTILQAQLRASGIENSDVCGHFEIGNIEELPPAKLSEALLYIQKHAPPTDPGTDAFAPPEGEPF